MFKKILIANRGEIACRVMKTAKKMGIKTVAVYSEADKDSMHVLLADEAVCIGPAASKESYLVIDKIIDACKRTGAEAVHPGYGFLSENEEFSRRLEESGVVFIGPKHYSVAAMGDKIASKKLAMQAGVNTIPGYNAEIADAAQAVSIASGIGYPVMIKASAGGGGKGLRVAFNDQEAAEGFDACRNEARNSFGDDRVFIEKFVEGPHHIEIQIIADSFGNTAYLFERECSIQRRHQKVLEEAPSPFIDETIRKAMGEQAVALAKAVKYQSAGTVEFVVGSDKSFYFLEMNTRLQVEHPVTEMITGLDLVELMIRVAAGEKLPFAQEDLTINGWAIECRINAEDPFRGFLPSVGRLVKYRPPEVAEGQVRVDTGVFEGGEISMYYDSMIAKLICHGGTRDQAVSRVRDALNAFVIRGIDSNIPFQAALMQNQRFLSGVFTTSFIAEEFPNGFDESCVVHEDPGLLAALAAFGRRRYIDRAVQISDQMPGHQRKVGRDWVVQMEGKDYPVSVVAIPGGYSVSHGVDKYDLVSDWMFGELVFRGTCNGAPICLQLERIGLLYRVVHFGKQVKATVMTANAARMLALMPKKVPPDLSKFLLSPMPGLLREVAVANGQQVAAGEKLAVIEAMKMENVLKAERDCKVKKVVAAPGESLSVDQVIIEFE
ncbi:MAG: Acetyl-/propionyl-coenzyme A carboxylase alpha chain [Candidatus Accumulibacter sp. BA-94]|uniref:acetyl-CoA carboxylase biotin carboxylase subunit n=1 Tax=Accumulibacter sp. TaxID=2053492 RepID=UPI0004462EE4|nr:acetyl/propionyl/methylcrotonyl-CoA carboxylase subunit alpha [Accumulibacter sp.]EXI88276.1 MAG: Acetyl-/propionyl-coenzyme A carboxylase alpha chain [Candidatus Accumulibacter sp. BA-94]MBL8390837.1 acetyl/propionyl/methylcrotonyl-CoA carboxylase subunit alpha [Accumulibacter sp.]HRD88854.1 acetyl/propionyl/methylcrotonyl-CoA carboxylase subunit alpha [Accumulibacter sp.]